MEKEKTTEDTYEEKNMKEAKKTLALAKSEEILNSRKGKGFTAAKTTPGGDRPLYRLPMAGILEIL
jgi:hypothetical protein